MMDKICDEKQCTGCSACASVCPKHCIDMLPDKEGFLRPHIDFRSCIECKKCVNTCPIINQRTDGETQPLSFAARHKDKQVLKQSSSGGAFTALACQILEDNGLVYGAGFDEKFNVVHKKCSTSDGLDELRRSKYVQSSIGDSYIRVKQALGEEQKVLFCGTPCQVSGLKAFLGRDYDNLFTIDFICHGVPSPKAWRKYLEFREKNAESSAEQIVFRSKEKGWKTYSLKILFKNKSVYSQDVTQDIYLRSFIMNLTLRPSCYACNFKAIHHISDITMADFWGFDETICAEWNNDTGISCVMAHSKKGLDLLNNAKQQVTFISVPFDFAIKNNPSMKASVKEPSCRKKFMNDLNQKSFDKVYIKYCSPSLLSWIRRKLASIIR